MLTSHPDRQAQSPGFASPLHPTHKMAPFTKSPFIKLQELALPLCPPHKIISCLDPLCQYLDCNPITAGICPSTLCKELHTSLPILALFLNFVILYFE